MKITIRFFGMIAEATEKNTVELNNIVDVASMINSLNTDFPKLSSRQYAIAVNKKITTGNLKLNDGDEIALLPPFAGG